MDEEIKKFIDDTTNQLRLELLQYMGENNVARDATENETNNRLNKLENNS